MKTICENWLECVLVIFQWRRRERRQYRADYRIYKNNGGVNPILKTLVALQCDVIDWKSINVKKKKYSLREIFWKSLNISLENSSEYFCSTVGSILGEPTLGRRKLLGTNRNPLYFLPSISIIIIIIIFSLSFFIIIIIICISTIYFHHPPTPCLDVNLSSKRMNFRKSS